MYIGHFACFQRFQIVITFILLLRSKWSLQILLLWCLLYHYNLQYKHNIKPFRRNFHLFFGIWKWPRRIWKWTSWNMKLATFVYKINFTSNFVIMLWRWQRMIENSSELSYFHALRTWKYSFWQSFQNSFFAFFSTYINATPYDLYIKRCVLRSCTKRFFTFLIECMHVILSPFYCFFDFFKNSSSK